MDYDSILNIMMWIVASGVALVVASSMVLLVKSFQDHGMNEDAKSSHAGYDEFYDASVGILSPNVGEDRF